MSEREANPVGHGKLGPAVAELARLRSRAKLILIIAAAAALVSVFIAGSLLLGITDYLIRAPQWMRVLIWLLGVGAIGYAAIRWLAPVLRFRPPLTELALRLERSERARAAGLEGKLASGIELASGREDTPISKGLARQVVEEAAQRFGGVHAGAILDTTHARHALLAAGACASLTLLIGLLVGSGMMSIGVQRVLTPWAAVEWPKRTQIADATFVGVHPVGQALPLRAAVIRTDQAPTKTRVAAVYRVLVGERSPEPTRVLLTSQGRSVVMEGADAGSGQGELYERLIEPGALALGGSGALVGEVEYWFETDDDKSLPQRIKLVQPPVVVGAKAVVRPPEYADIGEVEGGGGGTRPFRSGEFDLGAGNDQRAVVGPVLAGSSVELRIRLNKPVPTGEGGEPEERGAQPRRIFAEADLGPEANVTFAGDEWLLKWPARSSVRLPVKPVDEYGLESPDESIFAFDVVEDRPPAATVTEPREDESVLATAVVQAQGEGRDDVGLASVSLETQVAKPTRGSIGAAPEPAGDRATVASSGSRNGAMPLSAGSLQATVQASIDLAGLDLEPGDELWLTALAADNFTADGVRRDPVRSSPRKLRVIKEEELVEQVRAELSAVRKIAIRLDQEQADLRRAAEGGTVSQEEQRRQSGLAQRIGQQAESIQRLSQRLERNRLGDESLEGLLSDLNQLLEGAEADAQEASARMEAATRSQPEGERAELPQEESQRLQDAQESVRDQLGRLAEMLDRGEDSWLANRMVQRLIQQQRDLMNQTQRAGDRTMGRRAEDLTPQERSDLAQLAEQQQRLADSARQAIEELSRRSEQMKSVDAAQSQGMQQAAERGRQQQVPQSMEEAARSTQQNQTSTANEQQQQAMQALEQMLEDMQEAGRNRDQALRRQLASIIEKLGRLIQDQEAQLQALAAAVERNDPAGLDLPMIALNQNTLAAADEARGDREMARVHQLIDRAARAQGEAIAALRAAPVQTEEAEKQERESLRVLRLALAEAQKLQEQAAERDAERKRQELRRFYREMLEQQVALKGETDPFVGREIDRRDRMKVRGLGERQDGLRAAIVEAGRKTEGLDEAGVFKYAHERLEQVTTVAAKKLQAGQPDRIMARNQESAVRLLKSIVEALSDNAQRDDEFRDADGGDGGGGGGGGGEQPLFPPLAELRLLREMQQEAADLTRAIDEAGRPAPEEIAAVGQLQRGLAERGRELIEKLQGQNTPAAPERREGERP